MAPAWDSDSIPGRTNSLVGEVLRYCVHLRFLENLLAEGNDIFICAPRVCTYLKQCRYTLMSSLDGCAENSSAGDIRSRHTTRLMLFVWLSKTSHYCRLKKNENLGGPSLTLVKVYQTNVSSLCNFTTLSPENSILRSKCLHDCVSVC